MSKLGKKPINIPKDTKVKIESGKLTLTGPKGSKELTLNDKIFTTSLSDKNDLILNLIKKNGNYGWPISSYGEPYSFISKTRKNYKYKKEHKQMGFIEPIYSFVPSIGISQIIKVPKDFSIYWKDNFLVPNYLH